MHKIIFRDWFWEGIYTDIPPSLRPWLLHQFNRHFSRTTWVSRHWKGKPFWILLEQEMTGWQWHQLDHMQIICTSTQTDNHNSTGTSPLIFTGQMPFLPPNQQRQSTQGTLSIHKITNIQNCSCGCQDLQCNRTALLDLTKTCLDGFWC